MAWQKDSSSVSQIPQASVSSVWSDYSLYSNPQAVVQQQQQHQTNVMTVPNYPLPTSWPVQAPYFIQSHTQIPIVSTSNPALMMNVPPIPTNATISQQYYDYYAFQQQQQQQQTGEIDAAWLFKKDSPRPPKIVIIMRGLPGSGKTYMANIFKSLEIQNFHNTPRIISIDDYFMEEKCVPGEIDPETGKQKMNKILEFNYDPDMFELYSASALKQFEKTVKQGLFSFIIVDNINNKIKMIEDYWYIAKSAGYEVYVFETSETDPKVCAQRNIHKRTLAEIEFLKQTWEPLPPHFIRLKLGNLLSGEIFSLKEISEVEMSTETQTDETNKLINLNSIQSETTQSSSQSGEVRKPSWKDEEGLPEENILKKKKKKRSLSKSDERNNEKLNSKKPKIEEKTETQNDTEKDKNRSNQTKDKENLKPFQNDRTQNQIKDEHTVKYDEEMAALMGIYTSEDSEGNKKEIENVSTSSSDDNNTKTSKTLTTETSSQKTHPSDQRTETEYQHHTEKSNRSSSKSFQEMKGDHRQTAELESTKQTTRIPVYKTLPRKENIFLKKTREEQLKFQKIREEASSSTSSSSTTSHHQTDKKK